MNHYKPSHYTQTIRVEGAAVYYTPDRLHGIGYKPKAVKNHTFHYRFKNEKQFFSLQIL
jgi:hypothetical protein